MNQNYHTHWDTLVHVFVIVCEFCKISEASFMICVTQYPTYWDTWPRGYKK